MDDHLCVVLVSAMPRRRRGLGFTRGFKPGAIFNYFNFTLFPDFKQQKTAIKADIKSKLTAIKMSYTIQVCLWGVSPLRLIHKLKAGTSLI
jgi:hypothetical protein